jgi:hypothetical protein
VYNKKKEPLAESKKNQKKNQADKQENLKSEFFQEKLEIVIQEITGSLISPELRRKLAGPGFLCLK